MKKSKFISLDSLKHSTGLETKREIKEVLTSEGKDPRYSGKERGFYVKEI